MEFIKRYLRKLSLIAKTKLGIVNYRDLEEVFEMVNREETEWLREGN